MQRHGCAIGLSTLFATSVAAAGEVTGGSSGCVQVSNSAWLNNDNAPVQSPNVVTNSYQLASPASHDIVFSVIATEGVTEYFVSTSITNAHTLAIEGITFQLGVGSGAAFVAIDANGSLADLDFDAPDWDPTMYSQTLASIMTSTYKLAAKGGLIAPGATSAFGFSIDVPDGLDGGYEFTLRTTPTFVPAPGAVALLLAAMAAASGRRRTR